MIWLVSLVPFLLFGFFLLDLFDVRVQVANVVLVLRPEIFRKNGLLDAALNGSQQSVVAIVLKLPGQTAECLVDDGCVSVQVVVEKPILEVFPLVEKEASPARIRNRLVTHFLQVAAASPYDVLQKCPKEKFDCCSSNAY